MGCRAFVNHGIQYAYTDPQSRLALMGVDICNFSVMVQLPKYAHQGPKTHQLVACYLNVDGTWILKVLLQGDFCRRRAGTKGHGHDNPAARIS